MHLVFPPPFPWLFLGRYTSSLIIGHNSPPAHLQCNAHVVHAAWPPPFQLPTSAVHFASSPLPPPILFLTFLSLSYISRIHQDLLVPNPRETGLLIQKLLSILLFQEVYIYVGKAEGEPVTSNEWRWHFSSPQWLCDLVPTLMSLAIHCILDLFSGHHPIKSNQKKLIPLLHYVAMLHLFLHKIIKTKYKWKQFEENIKLF